MEAAELGRRRGNDLGPTGRRLAENLSETRRTAGVSTRELARQLEAVGRPIAATGITKIEAGGATGRRVDADDLVALAMVLCSTPNRLLLTPTSSAELVDLTDKVQEPQNRAWAWADGNAPLDYHLDPAGPGGIRDARHVNAVRETLERRGRPRSSSTAGDSSESLSMARTFAGIIVDVANQSGLNPLILASQVQMILASGKGQPS